MSASEKENNDITSSTLSLRVTLAVFSAIAFQLFGVVWYFSKLDSRVTSIETDLYKHLQVEIGGLNHEAVGSRVLTLEMSFNALEVDFENLEQQVQNMLNSERSLVPLRNGFIMVEAAAMTMY